MSKLVKIATTSEVSPGTGKAVEVEGKSIALFNVAGELAEEAVTCPWHGAKFNVKTGDVLGPPARKGVRSYPVKVQGNDVLVELD